MQQVNWHGAAVDAAKPWRIGQRSRVLQLLRLTGLQFFRPERCDDNRYSAIALFDSDRW
jgi:hypothetical protein